jgi:hypothetical protein
MKKLILIALILLFSFGFLKTNSNSEVIFSIEKGHELKENNHTLQVIPATLKNISKDTLYFASMSCSWQDLYYMNNQDLILETDACDKNIPVILTLAPNETKTVILKLRKMSKISYDNVKLGFNFIKLKSKTDKIDMGVINKINKSNLIFSNTVSFEKPTKK